MAVINSPVHELSKEQEVLVKRAFDYKKASLSSNTWRTYFSMWNKFTCWCQKHHAASLPTSAETVAVYLGDIASNVSFATLDASIAAIVKIHKENGVSIKGDSQLFLDVRRGIRRTHKEKLRVNRAPALSLRDFRDLPRDS